MERVVNTGLGRIRSVVTGSGPDLLLLHSLLTDSEAFDPVLGALTSKWTVNQLDLPGFGGSSAVAGDTIDAQAEAIAALLDAGDFDRDSTVLAGNGYGAFVALGTAVGHGDKFDRLLLIGCGTGFTEAGRAAFANMAARVGEGGMEAVVEVGIRRIFTEDYLQAHPEEAEARRRVLRAIDPSSFRRACLALESLDYSESVSHVNNQTLVVTGSADQATPPELGRHLAEAMPKATYVELAGLAHAPQLQDPAAFIDSVSGFLNLEG